MLGSKPLKFFASLLIIFAVVIGLISIDHPVILKWLTGSARHFGTAIPATIYANGKLDDKIKVFYTDEPDNYLLYLPGIDDAEMASLLNLNLSERFLGKPAGASAVEYDFIAGHLFQNRKEEVYESLQDDSTTGKFDPRFLSSEEELSFNLPTGRFAFDSVRIRWR